MGANRCAVCGAVISDDNSTGIGFGCMANVIKPAINETMWAVYGLDIWVEKAQRVRTAFLEAYKEVKFRSAFRKSFYESMQTAERISKKQLEIMMNLLEHKYVQVQFGDIIESYRWKVESGNNKECEKVLNENIQKHKKLYLSGKKNHTED